MQGEVAVKRVSGVAILAVVMALAGCEREVHLEGERLDPRAVLDSTAGAGGPQTALAEARPLHLPAPRANADWPQRAGAADHGLVNAAFGAGQARLWSAPIGQGNSYRYRVAASPVAAAGRVFTLDAHSRLSATSLAGAALWATDIAAPGDRPEDATGAGLAVDGGRVYATTGFAELVALDAASGAVIWRQSFDAGVGGAPTVAGGLVYVVARDGSAWAVRSEDGKVAWQMGVAPGAAGVSGVSAPAVTGDRVIFPFASGEMVAAARDTGSTIWQAKVAGARLGRGYAIVSDLTGDPVVSGGVVYAGSSAGKLGAFELETGKRLWTAGEGAMGPVQVAGGALFLVSDEGRLMRLDAGTGETVWAVDLPYYVKDKIKRQREIFVQYGPILAGNRLFVASSDGLLRSFDAASGAELGQAEIPGGAAADPIVAGQTLYVVSRNGQLHAFR